MEKCGVACISYLVVTLCCFDIRTIIIIRILYKCDQWYLVYLNALVKVQNFQNTTFKLGCLSTLLEIGILKHTSNPFLTLRGDLFRSNPTVRDVSGSFKSQNME